MSSRTVYKCDMKSCQKEIPSEKLMSISIDINANTEIYDFGNGNRKKYVRLELCPNCAEKFGITQRVLLMGREEPINKVITPEEKLVDAIKEIIFLNFNGNQ